MGSRAVIFCGAAVVLLAGCGSSSHKTNASATSSTSSSPATSKPLSMQARLLTGNELPGFTGSPSSPETSASQWVSETDSGLSASQQAAQVKRLTRLAFVAGDSEDLNDGSTAGVSSVEQFKTAREAQAEVDAEAAQFLKIVARQGTISQFTVPGIPGARGYAVVSGSGGVNISFAKGPYAYVAGQELLGGETLNTAKAKLIAAARHEYARVTP